MKRVLFFVTVVLSVFCAAFAQAQDARPQKAVIGVFSWEMTARSGTWVTFLIIEDVAMDGKLLGREIVITPEKKRLETSFGDAAEAKVSLEDRKPKVRIEFKGGAGPRKYALNLYQTYLGGRFSKTLQNGYLFETDATFKPTSLASLPAS